MSRVRFFNGRVTKAENHSLFQFVINKTDRMNSKFWMVALIWAICLPAAKAQPIDDPFLYTGGSQAEYDGYEMTSQYVELSDGTRIATDVYLPTGGPPRTSFPVIFQFTAYNRSILIPRFGPLKWIGAKLLGLGDGPVFDMSEIVPSMAFLMEHGYAMVVADMRGTGASFGSQLPLMPQLGKDGAEMVDWIGTQGWCDGNVGMMGPSYLGWIQYMTAAEQPEALKCIMPEVIGFDMYSSGFRPGGILARRWISDFDKALLKLNRNWFDLKENAVPSLPVVDEDGDGSVTDEWPQMDSASQLSGIVPRFDDGEARDNSLYYQATLEHLDNVLIRELADEAYRYRDAPGPAGYEDISFASVAPAGYLDGIASSGIAIYNVAGWFDGFCRGPFRYYSTLASTNPSRLFAAPRFHFGTVPKYYRKELGYRGQYSDHLGWEKLRFFDQHLKGIHNDLEHRPPVLIYVMNAGWKLADSWPLPETEYQDWYAHQDGSLSPDVPDEGTISYQVDFTVSSDYGKNDLNRWTMTSPGPGAVMERGEIDQQCLTITSQPLNAEMEITGHPIVELWLSSNQSAGDVFVYLEEVDESGRSLYVTEGMLRSDFRREEPESTLTNGGIVPKPVLPWHGYRKESHLSPSLGSQPVCLRFDMYPTSWKMRKGSRIRISIAGADQHNFELHPDLCSGDCPEDCQETEYKFHLGGKRASRILLPVIPPGDQ